MMNQPRVNTSTYQQTVQPYMTPSTLNYTCRNFMVNRVPVPNMPPPRGSKIICYGCGEKGYGMSTCPAINDLIAEGGRIAKINGLPIGRINGETFIQAFEWEEPPQSHLIMVDANEYYGSDAESKDGRDVVFAINNFELYTAEWPAKQIATK
jgi:hypothetical protein